MALRIGLVTALALTVAACSKTAIAPSSTDQANVVTQTVILRGHPNGLALDSGAAAVAEPDVNLFEEATPTLQGYSVNNVVFTGRGPQFIASGPSELATSNAGDNNISIWLPFASPPRVDSVAAGNSPMGLIYFNQTLFVANNADGTVSAINSNPETQYQLLRTIAVGKGPTRLAKFDLNALVYVSNSDPADSSISIIDVKKLMLIGSIPLPVGSRPRGLGVVPRSRRLYVALEAKNSVAVVDVDNPGAGELLEIPVGIQPEGLAINAEDNEVFVTNFADNTVSLIDGAFNVVKKVVPVGQGPVDVIVEPVKGDVWVSNSLEKSLTVFSDPGRDTRSVMVPVRLCATRDSSEAVSPGTLVHHLQAANEIFLSSGAHILFQPVGPPSMAVPMFTPGTNPPFASDAPALRLGCDMAWQPFSSDLVGTIPVILVQRWADNSAGNGWGGTTDLVRQSNGTPGARNSDICVHPRAFQSADLSDVLSFDYAVEMDWDQYDQNSPANQGAMTLAHELGHALLLGHGNGLDDDPNMNSTFPPASGPRDYDTYCDSLGWTGGRATQVPVEDCPDGGLCLSPCPRRASLMQEPPQCPFLQELQVEQSQEIAAFMPSAVGAAPDSAAAVPNPPSCASPPCGIPSDIYLEKLSISDNPTINATVFGVRVFSPLSNSTDAEYVFLADLDGDATTGCAGSLAGPPTSFAGAELAAIVDAVGTNLTAHVLKCTNNGAFVQVADSGIATRASMELLADSAGLGRGSVMVSIPDSVRGSMGQAPRLLVLASEANQSDQLPRAAPDGVVVNLTPLQFPTCSLLRTTVQPGETDTVNAIGLPPNAPAQVAFFDRVLANFNTGNAGQATVSFTVPSNTRGGLRLLTVGQPNTTNYASCILRVGAAPVSPATIASVVPTPNPVGWNNTPVVVTLVASPAAGDAAISSITFSATGAQPFASTTVNDSLAAISLTREGATNFSFFATDSSGAQESPEPLTVAIDLTSPEITAQASPPPNAFGWNNTPVQVRFSCADTLSGISRCSSPVTISIEGVQLPATGSARDAAGNQASVSVLVNIDETPPLITFTGTGQTYTVDETVSIDCFATDALSGIQSSTCSPIVRPAYTFIVGANSVSASAVDFAGNQTTTTGTFVVAVTYASLCHLAERFDSSAGIANSLCAKLQAAADAAASGNLNAKTGQLNAFRNELKAQMGRTLSISAVTTLLKLVAYL